MLFMYTHISYIQGVENVWTNHFFFRLVRDKKLRFSILVSYGFDHFRPHYLGCLQKLSFIRKLKRHTKVYNMATVAIFVSIVLLG